jgi:hypothetical protein
VGRRPRPQRTARVDGPAAARPPAPGPAGQPAPPFLDPNTHALPEEPHHDPRR